MARSVRPIAGLVLACVVGLVGGSVQPAAAADVDDPVRGIALTGVCPTSPDVSKDVRAVHLFGGPWMPYLVFDEKMTPVGLLFPYQVTFSGVGLKARHFVPGETYTRPGPTPANTVACAFDGTTTGGPVHVDVNGTVVVFKPRSATHAA